MRHVPRNGAFLEINATLPQQLSDSLDRRLPGERAALGVFEQ
ncbi:MAG: hypothetical protein M0038_06825 [Pseudomonadota bacterium]|jgi:hypothetical protein|nr:hypothetical protein [Pseudomonadota bacterium]